NKPKLSMKSEKRKELVAQVILVLLRLVEVFGSDKGKRTLRGFSSSVSKKRVKQAFLTAAVYESTNKCNSPVIGLKK
ncbi:hypothetical protein MKW94_009125, partial [Papaver nudicaule]|nr:hypothetical protein [Papaver nudicaule]